MKKVLTLATFALLFTGAAFAGDGKNCGKGKHCCKKEGKKGDKKDKVVKSEAPTEKKA